MSNSYQGLELNDQEYQDLTDQILKLTGIDLENYKPNQMRRRLDGHISAQAGSIAEYRQLIQKDKEVLTKLKNFITINVSEFFRDAPQFDTLKNKILPSLLERSSALKVWSAGCSHGGEPYSIAMLLEELASGQHHRVVATDIDERILSRARQGGPYLASDISNVPKGFILKYFEKKGDDFYVIPQLRRKIEFKQQNVLSDRFDKGFDLILCRNVVIYFSDEAKARLYRGFYDSLKDDGILFIGATETLLGARDLGLDRLETCFYQKGSVASKPRGTLAGRSR